jgi:two-component system LytT family response regulator
MTTRTLIVDDEALARKHLLSLLADEQDFEMAGECADGKSAVRSIVALEPDLVFLDVQMPGMNGFEVLEALGRERLPAVVFVTAFDQFAVKAFDAEALDYLLKPFRRERFRETLTRVRRGLIARNPAQLLAPTRVAPDRMVVKCGDRLVFVPFDELDFIRASANYVRLHLGRSTYDARETIAAMESRLPADRFVRIHRSFIVNLATVRELYHAGGGEYMVILRSDKQLPVGSSYAPIIRNALAHAGVPRFGTIGGI